MKILKQLTDNRRYVVYMRERAENSLFPWETLVCRADGFGNYNGNSWPLASRCWTDEDTAYFNFLEDFKEWNCKP